MFWVFKPQVYNRYVAAKSNVLYKNVGEDEIRSAQGVPEKPAVRIAEWHKTTSFSHLLIEQYFSMGRNEFLTMQSLLRFWPVAEENYVGNVRHWFTENGPKRHALTNHYILFLLSSSNNEFSYSR